MENDEAEKKLEEQRIKRLDFINSVEIDDTPEEKEEDNIFDGDKTKVNKKAPFKFPKVKLKALNNIKRSKKELKNVLKLIPSTEIDKLSPTEKERFKKIVNRLIIAKRLRQKLKKKKEGDIEKIIKENPITPKPYEPETDEEKDRDDALNEEIKKLPEEEKKRMNDGRKGLMKKILAVLVAAGIISGAGLAAVLAATAKAANTTAAAAGEAAAATVEAVVQCGGTVVVCGGGGGGGIATGGGGVIATGGGGVVTGGGGVVTGGGIATGGGGVVCGGPVLVPPLGPTVIGCGIEGGVGPVMGSQTFAELMGLLFQLEFAPLASIGGNIIGSLIAIFESLAIGAAPLLEILASTFCSTAMAPVLAAVMGIAPYVAIVVVA